METVQQMNVRIGSDLKRRGDKVLARWGLSPSEGVRGFYDLITRGDKRSEEALAAVSGKAPSTEEARATEQLRRHEEVARFQASMQTALKAIGVKEGAVPVASDKELLEEALVERMEEKGLW